MERLTVQTPTALGDVEVSLWRVLYPDEGDLEKQAHFSIQVLNQEGQVMRVVRGDLVPYLTDESTFLTAADRAWLLDFIGRVMQEAEARVLPEGG